MIKAVVRLLLNNVRVREYVIKWRLCCKYERVVSCALHAEQVLRYSG